MGSSSESAKQSWQDATKRANRTAGLKAAWTEERKEAAKRRASNPDSGCFQSGQKPSEETRAILSAKSRGQSNPYFGKKHTEEVRRKMQRPRGVIHRGISPEEYQSKLDSGFRWCVDHKDFLPDSEFSRRGFRNGIHRKGSHCKVCVRRKWLHKAYKVTPEWYEIELAKQGGHCALCLVTEKEEGRPLAVDHDHVTGAARGILCTRCNSAMERMDIAGWAVSAIAYLAQRSPVLR